jgi:hypothetical protein
MRMAERLNYLRRMPPLETATFGKLQPITTSMQEQILTRGDSLLTEGGGDAGFFMVHEGELKVPPSNHAYLFMAWPPPRNRIRSTAVRSSRRIPAAKLPPETGRTASDCMALCARLTTHSTLCLQMLRRVPAGQRSTARSYGKCAPLVKANTLVKKVPASSGLSRTQAAAAAATVGGKPMSFAAYIPSTLEVGTVFKSHWLGEETLLRCTDVQPWSVVVSTQVHSPENQL